MIDDIARFVPVRGSEAGPVLSDQRIDHRGNLFGRIVIPVREARRRGGIPADTDRDRRPRREANKESKLIRQGRVSVVGFEIFIALKLVGGDIGQTIQPIRRAFLVQAKERVQQIGPFDIVAVDTFKHAAVTGMGRQNLRAAGLKKGDDCEIVERTCRIQPLTQRIAETLGPGGQNGIRQSNCGWKWRHVRVPLWGYIPLKLNKVIFFVKLGGIFHDQIATGLTTTTH